MTTKVERYRFRRTSPAVEALLAGLGDDALTAATEAAGDRPSPEGGGPVTAPQDSFAAPAPERAPDPAPPPSGRQLRLARRKAQKLGLAPKSDLDAVRMLEAKGLDPFAIDNGLDDLPEEIPGAVLPAAEARARDALPAPQRRQREIYDIRRDIARRRRVRTAQLLVRLALFIFLPTLLAGWYFFRVATPMYATRSEFVILQADAATGPLGGIFAGTQFATNQDSISVQSFLQSMDAMLRLDRDLDFVAHFSQPWIDAIQRMPENATNEQAYAVYKKRVKIGYDPSEGVIRMEVSAADPGLAEAFATHLIRYAEDRVDALSQRKREDAMRSAEDSLKEARAERRDAQERLVRLQEGTLLDPQAVVGSLRSQINTIEMQIQEKDLQKAALLDNLRPNEARVAGVQSDIDRLNDMLAELNARMTRVQSDRQSLAETTVQVQMAQADLSTSDMFLQSALENEKQASLEASRQVRYLTTSVRPVQPQSPSYPRAFEDTLLVMLVLSGGYLMISLTAAILREQVSS
ncbi:capsule biosynthesis protein [Pseudooceanicola sp. CBS1P-1]|uniref:Capsule biosynthesis protein n=1 Tax=Pseudooceanicola albus TaxID=2692189 RepID=A0A6L7G409_9RHOB|nr:MULTISPECIES: capsule biosynthesis protein [Pseudooceanicola]MBT9384905.1 capsule biosynthesis protein [Pseudooceanicola endophyticus]MXN18100.1 capsule biosynthesis protein [Pseudooceanicola albus]